MSTSDMWTYSQQSDLATMDLTGYSVQATDGSIGKIDEASNDAGASYIVVDTGPWILGKKVMLPAGVLMRADHKDETVWVSLSKDEIKDAPEFDQSTYREAGYRDDLGGYYGRFKRR